MLGGPGGHGPRGTEVTDTAVIEKVTAAAVAKVDGLTVDHVMQETDGSYVALGHTADGVTKVEAEVLSPACRVGGGSSGWASLFMLTERLRWGLARGSRLTRFSFFSNNRPTRRIAARLAARPIAEARMYRIEVPAS